MTYYLNLAVQVALLGLFGFCAIDVVFNPAWVLSAFTTSPTHSVQVIYAALFVLTAVALMCSSSLGYEVAKAKAENGGIKKGLLFIAFDKIGNVAFGAMLIGLAITVRYWSSSWGMVAYGLVLIVCGAMMGSFCLTLNERALLYEKEDPGQAEA